ncbi:MAG: transglycosylase [Scandinavium sp.]|uniref:transglycosylase n=1 Tax=Scandinavium sp. TaxID=2830653 RepID=UPI003F388797
MAICHPLILATLFAFLPAAYASHGVPTGYQQVAQQAAVPAGVLYAVALTESGASVQQTLRPWPWTLNVAGRSFRYATRSDACRALHQFLRTVSPQHIDVGLGQLNLGWNGYYFRTPCDVLAPYPNLKIAARLLRQHFEHWQSWYEAVGRYHHPTGGKPAQQYRQKVRRHMLNLSS